MSPYREPAETLTDERFDLDVGKLDIELTYISHPSEKVPITQRFQYFGSYSFRYDSIKKKVKIIVNKPIIEALLKNYHDIGFVGYFEGDRKIAIPIHLVIEMAFKKSKNIVTIDPNTNEKYQEQIRISKNE